MKGGVMRNIIVSFYFILTFLCSAAMGGESAGENVFTSPTLGAKFVLISAGTFTMGSPESELGRREDETQHRVKISSPFYMQTTEITQGQWKRVMGSNPSYFKDCGNDCPVEKVSWNDIQKFISKVNSKEGTDKYRLPTEDEWEYAARAGSQSDRYGDIDDIAWYDTNSGNKTHAVGQKQPNVWGLYDMLGNVSEWVQDRYEDYQVGSAIDPVGPSSGVNRVRRGGSWFDSAKSCRMASRLKHSPEYGDISLGFRLARTL
jgi:formylglycine-generating enzyme required for sulfatase activity